MEQTANFALNQWSQDDRIMMEDFNADNLKIDEALAGCLQVITGSFTGTGSYGKNSPNTLTFGEHFVPQVVIFPARCSATAFSAAVRGSSKMATSSSDGCNVTWSDHGLSWYYSGSTALYDGNEGQMSKADTVYPYIALGSLV